MKARPDGSTVPDDTTEIESTKDAVAYVRGGS